MVQLTHLYLLNCNAEIFVAVNQLFINRHRRLLPHFFCQKAQKMLIFALKNPQKVLILACFTSKMVQKHAIFIKKIVGFCSF